MPPPTIPATPGYLDVIQMLSDPRVKEDTEAACRGLAYAMGESVQMFESIGKQMHTIDLQRISAPFKPRWDAAFKVSPIFFINQPTSSLTGEMVGVCRSSTVLSRQRRLHFGTPQT
jgi:hypothetical protein